MSPEMATRSPGGGNGNPMPGSGVLAAAPLTGGAFLVVGVDRHFSSVIAWRLSREGPSEVTLLTHGKLRSDLGK